MFATIIISALVAPVALGGRILPSSSRIERAPEIHESEHELSEFHTPQARLLFQCELLHLMHTVCSLLSLHQSGGLAAWQFAPMLVCRLQQSQCQWQARGWVAFVAVLLSLLELL